MFVVFQALSVIQSLPNPRNKDLNDLAAALHALQQSTEKTVIRWIPSHCNIRGNKEADRLAKEGGKLPQLLDYPIIRNRYCHVSRLGSVSSKLL